MFIFVSVRLSRKFFNVRKSILGTVCATGLIALQTVRYQSIALHSMQILYRLNIPSGKKNQIGPEPDSAFES